MYVFVLCTIHSCSYTVYLHVHVLSYPFYVHVHLTVYILFSYIKKVHVYTCTCTCIYMYMYVLCVPNSEFLMLKKRVSEATCTVHELHVLYM